MLSDAPEVMCPTVAVVGTGGRLTESGFRFGAKEKLGVALAAVAHLVRSGTRASDAGSP